MQLGVDVKCMKTNFSGCRISGFGDIATSNLAKFSFWTMDYYIYNRSNSPWSLKILVQ